MCGIIAYVGPLSKKIGAQVVVDGLKKLEYRGYDSWGVAIKSENGFDIRKEVGKISDFKDVSSLGESCVAMGHTRWATNGSVTEANAHPHTCCKGNIAVVHNGIIENFQELKKSLASHTFTSETDTEIIAHLIEDMLASGASFETATKNVLTKLNGRFALVAMCADSKKLIAARKGSPLVVGYGDDSFFIGSDIPAFLEYTRDVVFLDDGDVATIRHDPKSTPEISFTDFTGGNITHDPVKIDWSAGQAELDGHDHYMIKEILEQRSTVGLAVSQDPEKMDRIAAMINEAKDIFLIGCGTAGKVGMVGSYIFSKIAKKHVHDVVGSEFPNYHDFLSKDSLILCISQSGETADTLEAIEVAKTCGCKVVSIVNVMGSTMMRMSDEYILCNSGPEKAVCSTKVTTAQIAILTVLAYACEGKLDEGKTLMDSLAKKLSVVLDDQYLNEIRFLSKKVAGYESMYIIGRSLNYPMALEAAIKMQEVPYIHAEGFAGGELKHGPIALIEPGTPCIAMVAEDDVKNETLINALEIKSRGGFIIGIAPDDNEIFDFWIPVPDLKIASPIVNIIPIQLLSYYTALEKNCDPDKPRNLAKSVTVK